MRLFKPRPAPALKDEVAEAPLSERTLFIIGAARSGTTVLQNALNDSPDIFLLGEPDLYDDGEPGFAARYNAMHRSWGNQATKSSYLPAVSEIDGGWRDHLAALARHHRWVGAKLVINPVRAEDELSRRFDFHSQHFYRSRYIFTFRDPLPTAISTRDLQILTLGQTDGLKTILRNTVEVIALYIQMTRLLPYVRAVFHDRVEHELFQDLQAWLDTPLPNALTYYDRARVRDYSQAQVEDIPADVIEAIQRLYLDLRESASAGFVTPQLEQNDHHLSPTHYTALGSLDRRARVLAEALG
jgi:hypothetical protein